MANGALKKTGNTETRAGHRLPLAALAILAAIIAIIVFAVYTPSLGSGFVNWDDPAYVYKNAHIRSIDPAWAFTTVMVGIWLPVTMLSYAVDYAVWGLDPFGYHLTNNILHALNSSLVLVITAMLYRKAAGTQKSAAPLIAGAAAALLFGLHPLRVESVVWVAERKDVLSAFFFLLSVLAYLRYAAGGRAALWAASLLAFVLALLSKPMAVTLPAVLLLIDLYPLGRFSSSGAIRKALIEKVPFFVLSVAAGVLAVWAQSKGGALSPVTMTLPAKIAAAIKAAAFYLYKTMVPLGLAPFYPHPESSAIFTPAAILSVAVISAIVVISAVTFKKRRYITAAFLCYFITLAPVSGIIQVGSQAAADRYTYLPTISLFMLAGAAFASVSAGRLKAPAMAIGVIILAALSWATIGQSAIWKDSVTLWSYEIEQYPDRVAAAYTNRGITLGSAGDDAGAVADFTKAVSIDPKMKMAWYNRALSLSNLGRYREAIGDLDAAIELDPLYADAYHNRGVAKANLADYGEAIEDLKSSVELDPSSGAAYMNLAMAQRMAGRPDEAQESFSAAYRLGVREAGQYIRQGQGN